MKTITSSWKQQLLKARAIWFLKHYSAARDHGVPAPALYTDQTANGLRKCLLDWLKYNGHYCNRITNKSKIINAIISGDHVAIEICFKSTQKLQPSDLKEKELIQSKCKIFYQATDMNSFAEWYKENFIPQLETRQ